MKPSDIKLISTITCPECGHQKKEIMPTEACQFFYECENCKALLKSKQGDCCVFCSYGTIPCPSIQKKSDASCCSDEIATSVIENSLYPNSCSIHDKAVIVAPVIAMRKTKT